MTSDFQPEALCIENRLLPTGQFSIRIENGTLFSAFETRERAGDRAAGRVTGGRTSERAGERAGRRARWRAGKHGLAGIEKKAENQIG